jgi:integrase
MVENLSNPLTLTIQSNILPFISTVEGWSMKGGIYPRGKCPVCGGKFIQGPTGYKCPEHLTQPARLYIRLYDRELHKHVNICSDSRGIPFSSYEQANRILTKIRAEIDAGTFEINRYISEKLKPLKFFNWSRTWLQKKELEVQKGLKSPSYLKAIQVYIRKFQSYFGETDIRDIGTKQIHEFYLSLSGAPHYIKNILTAFEKLLRDALDWEDIAQMPKFPRIDVPEPDIRTIDLDLQDTIIRAIPDPMDRTFILFMAREMVRPSETRAIQWDDIDLKHDRVTIRRHFSLNQLRPSTKAKQIKILPLDGEVKQALQNLPRHLISPFVFWKRNGKPFSETWARKLWKRISLSLGVDISLYQGTRHSSATEAAGRVGIDATQEFLHHTSRAMTKRYAKVNVKGLEKVLRKREEILSLEPDRDRQKESLK